jgi:adenine/guanine phosphoribosyltransferase-like PRPP-binding protein
MRVNIALTMPKASIGEAPSITKAALCVMISLNICVHEGVLLIDDFLASGKTSRGRS